MDDDLEDEIFVQTLLTHAKLMSNVMSNVATHYSPTVDLLGRQMRFYLVETVAMAVIVSVIAFTYVGQSMEKLWCFNFCKLFVNKASSSLGIQRWTWRFGGNPKLNVATAFGNNGQKTNWAFNGPNVGVYAIQGRRGKMEDRFSVKVADDDNMPSLYGVFDGHGGDFAADFVEKKLFASFATRVQSGKENRSEDVDCNEGMDYAQILSEEILAIDKKLLEVTKASKDLAGTTALVALVHRGKLVVANVGDSRGVICDGRGMAIPLSFDHKPQQLKEQKRIKQAGGFVAFNGVWRVAGILATSRALGDYPLKDRNLIIADPDVLTFDIEDLGPRFMILASDGLWDAFSNEEAVAFVKGRLQEPDFGAKSLTMQAYNQGSLDNITVMVVNFPVK